MELKQAWMENYKSISSNIKLDIDSKVTCIIGKNESGKSNILELLSNHTLQGKSKGITNDKKNRSRDYGDPTICEYRFLLSEEEK